MHVFFAVGSSPLGLQAKLGLVPVKYLLAGLHAVRRRMSLLPLLVHFVLQL